MEALRPFYHGIASAIQLLGLLVIVVGGMRIVRAPALAERRALDTPSAPVSIDRQRGVPDLPDGSDDRARYARGLVDFYRISGAVAVVAGIVLVLVPVFAG